jgi:hypothetical protein
MTVIEIEDYYGNTLCAFMIQRNNILDYYRCGKADDDNDYIFGTKHKLIRIQLTEE